MGDNISMHLGVHTECVDGSECRQMSLFDGMGLRETKMRRNGRRCA